MTNDDGRRVADRVCLLLRTLCYVTSSGQLAGLFISPGRVLMVKQRVSGRAPIHNEKRTIICWTILLISNLAGAEMDKLFWK